MGAFPICFALTTRDYSACQPRDYTFCRKKSQAMSDSIGDFAHLPGKEESLSVFLLPNRLPRIAFVIKKVKVAG
jgi:hypothetical protein